MPRKAEPSFELKTIIWDVAATVGKNKSTEIQRQLGYELEKQRQKGFFFEDEPDVRTISRIVKEIDTLSPEIVVSKLPAHVWKLRYDYENIRQLAGVSNETSQSKTDVKQTGITPEQTKRATEHDVRVFEKSDAIMNERKFERLNNLLKSGCFYSSQLDEVLLFQRFFSQESNKYVDFRLKHLCYISCAKLEELSEFIQLYSSEKEWWHRIIHKQDSFEFNDEWHRLIREVEEKSEMARSNQNGNDDIGYDQLYLVTAYTPAMQSTYDDLIKSGELESHNLESQYVEWKRKFDKLIDDTQTMYSEYRAAIRDILFL